MIQVKKAEYEGDIWARVAWFNFLITGDFIPSVGDTWEGR